MSDQADRGVAPMARVIEVDAAEERAPRRPLAPRIIPTERTEPVTPSEPAPVAVVAPDAPRRRDRVMTFGLAGVAVLFVGWLAVDAVGWIAAAFERSTALGVLAATAVTAGVAGAGAVIARELGSLFRLRNVEAIHRQLADQRALPTDARRPSGRCWRLSRASARSTPASRRFSARSSFTMGRRSRSRFYRARL
jgi:uncharacterized membrane protein YcjF (UPF0283 family)